MERERISITFEVDLDPVPGACHTLEYWVRATEQDFKRFPWYNPKITDSRIVKEAPTYQDQIRVLAAEVMFGSILDMLDELWVAGVDYGEVVKYQLDNKLTIEEAIKQIHQKRVKKEGQ